MTLYKHIPTHPQQFINTHTKTHSLSRNQETSHTPTGGVRHAKVKSNYYTHLISLTPLVPILHTHTLSLHHVMNVQMVQQVVAFVTAKSHVTIAQVYDNLIHDVLLQSHI